jgi:hypothetical protein
MSDFGTRTSRAPKAQTCSAQLPAVRSRTRGIDGPPNRLGPAAVRECAPLDTSGPSPNFHRWRPSRRCSG